MLIWVHYIGEHGNQKLSQMFVFSLITHSLRLEEKSISKRILLSICEGTDRVSVIAVGISGMALIPLSLTLVSAFSRSLQSWFDTIAKGGHDVKLDQKSL